MPSATGRSSSTLATRAGAVVGAGVVVGGALFVAPAAAAAGMASVAGSILFSAGYAAIALGVAPITVATCPVAIITGTMLAVGAGAVGAGAVAGGAVAGAVAVRNQFAGSLFKKCYDSCNEPVVHQHELLGALHAFIMRHCSMASIPAAEGDVFFVAVQTEAFSHASELLADIPRASQRLWTSAISLRGRELCSLLNEACRTADPELIKQAVLIVRSINTLLVHFSLKANSSGFRISLQLHSAEI
jgi:hypothetical protein